MEIQQMENLQSYNQTQVLRLKVKAKKYLILRFSSSAADEAHFYPLGGARI